MDYDPLITKIVTLRDRLTWLKGSPQPIAGQVLGPIIQDVERLLRDLRADHSAEQRAKKEAATA